MHTWDTPWKGTGTKVELGLVVVRSTKPVLGHSTVPGSNFPSRLCSWRVAYSHVICWQVVLIVPKLGKLIRTPKNSHHNEKKATAINSHSPIDSPISLTHHHPKIDLKRSHKISITQLRFHPSPSFSSIVPTRLSQFPTIHKSNPNFLSYWNSMVVLKSFQNQ